MSVLVIAEHDNASIKGATLNTVTAAVACGGDVHVLVAGHNAAEAAKAAGQIAGVSKVIHADSDALAQGFRDSVAQWPAFPDSIEALARLRKHFKLVTMTNAQTWALQHFQKTLGSSFDLLLACDDALCEKPDARYFAYARGRFEGAWGYKQADNLHVAQSQYHDIGISKKLGITTCWIERRHGLASSGGTIESEHTVPDYHFHTLAQLADAVDAGQ